MALIYAQHRNADLAERHLRRLQRENPEARVRITSRRNSAGKISERGHFFTFSITKLPSKLLAFLLSFSYDPRQKKSHGGNKSKLRADFIVAGESKLRGRDGLEVFQILIPKVIRELPEGFKWIAHLAQQVIGNDRAEIDSTPKPDEKPPKKAKIRSAYRNNKLLYGSKDSESE